ncbi:hypothetical protein [Mycobacterium dioxanotrophicus]|jgi:hypothetical protein|nr:hypothetical protein [Mycobacterium dioxanotrophicus]
MISNIKLSGVAVESMPSSFRAGYLLSARAGQAVPARAAVAAAARAGWAAAAGVAAVAVAAAPAGRHQLVANAVWPPVAGFAPQHKRRTAATPRVSVDWSPT